MYEYSRVNVKSELSVAQLLRLRSYIAFILFNYICKFDVIVEIHAEGIVLFLTFFVSDGVLSLASSSLTRSFFALLRMPCAISLPLKTI